jgi:hypothetical protein
MGDTLQPYTEKLDPDRCVAIAFNQVPAADILSLDPEALRRAVL